MEPKKIQDAINEVRNFYEEGKRQVQKSIYLGKIELKDGREAELRLIASIADECD